MTSPILRALTAVAAIVAVVLVANAPLLDDFARLLAMESLATSSSDASTHYLRMLHARDLYLPSGHRLGWEPFWFQGYVPFLLYPHLPYVLLALLSMALPVESARLFNAYTLAIYFALPLVASLLVLRSSGRQAAVLVAGWLSVVTAIGAGISTFQVGLIAQQAGLVLFAAFAHDVIVARRLDRAAIWLGLLPLVHVHGALAAGFAWGIAGAVALGSRKELRTWLESTLLALLVSLPTAVALVQGANRIGASTAFNEVPQVLRWLVEGRMIAPWPALVALVVCAAWALVAGSGERRRLAAWLGVVAVFFGVAAFRWQTGLETVDRALSTVFYLRTFSFAYVWFVMVAVASWQRCPKAVRVTATALTFGALVMIWPILEDAAPRIGTSWREGGQNARQSGADYREVLDWIATDAKGETTTLAISLMQKPWALPLLEAVERTGQPLLGGHGSELTDVRNGGFLRRLEETDCETIESKARDYAVGYFVGSTPEHRARLERCHSRAPAFERGDWWVFPTRIRWRNAAAVIHAFSHDPTWTELRWQLRQKRGESQLRLPVAHTAPWSAEVDGTRVAIETTTDGMMRVTVPGAARELTLRYEGFRGEWTVATVALAALVVAVRRTRRTSSSMRMRS